MEIWPGPCGGPLRATLPEGECIKVNCPEEPGAGILHAGICEGGAGQPASLPRQAESRSESEPHQEFGIENQKSEIGNRSGPSAKLEIRKSEIRKTGIC